MRMTQTKLPETSVRKEVPQEDMFNKLLLQMASRNPLHQPGASGLFATQTTLPAGSKMRNVDTRSEEARSQARSISYAKQDRRTSCQALPPKQPASPATESSAMGAGPASTTGRPPPAEEAKSAPRGGSVSADEAPPQNLTGPARLTEKHRVRRRTPQAPLKQERPLDEHQSSGSTPHGMCAVPTTGQSQPPPQGEAPEAGKRPLGEQEGQPTGGACATTSTPGQTTDILPQAPLKQEARGSSSRSPSLRGRGETPSAPQTSQERGPPSPSLSSADSAAASSAHQHQQP